MDVAHEIRVAMSTGKVIVGSKQTIKACAFGKAKLVIIASNCPESVRSQIEYYAKLSGVPIYVFPGSSWDLGAACRKPFMVASLAIIDPGDSDIMSLVEKEEVG